MIKKLLFLFLGIIITYSFLGLGQLWFNFLSLELFIKITISFGIISFINILSIGIAYTIKENNELKKGNYIC